MNIGVLKSIQYNSSILEAWESDNLNYFLELAPPQSHTDDNGNLAPTDVDKILFWIHKNLNVRPKIWLSKQLTRLNNLVQAIHVKIETLPGEKSLWNKIVSKITRVIMELTEKLNDYLKDSKSSKLEYRDSSGKVSYTSLGNINSSKKADRDINLINRAIDKFSDDKKAAAHKYLNKNNVIYNRNKSGFATDEEKQAFNDLNTRMNKLKWINFNQGSDGKDDDIRTGVLTFHTRKDKY